MKQIKEINKDFESNTVEIIFDDDTKMLINNKQYFCQNIFHISELNEDDVLKIQYEAKLDEAKSVALRYIAFRIKTKQEVMSKLMQNGYTMDICNKVCDELENQGYINDYQYCVKYISHSKKLKNMSMKMMLHNLKNKGIDEKTIFQAIKQFEINDLDSAIMLLSKKYKKNSINDINDKKKALAFLINKGFSYECSKSALQIYINSFQ